MPALRRLGNLALSFLVKLTSGYWTIFDPTNGYTAVRREVLSALALDRVADRYFFEVSMLVQLNLTNACVRDIPMPARYGDENSSLRIRRALLTFPPKLLTASVSRIWDKYFLYDFTAVSLFLTASIPLIGTGVFLGIRYWVHSFATGIPTTAGQVMLSVLPLLVGFQLLLQAFVTDINAVPQVSQFGPLLKNHPNPNMAEA
jgi:dolichol-phosphate mannosyltransferase